MFLYHAREFAKQGYRCVLLDLPGHGARMDEPLTMSSAIAAILDAVRLEAPPTADGHKPMYIGGSLGGYIGMELLGQHPNVFAGAVIAMCGQNVGAGAGLAARAGLAVMSCALGCMSAAGMMGAMRSAARRNGHIPDDLILEISLRPGMFFHQGAALIAALRATAPAAALPRFPGPVLFVNGSRDHRDSEQRWLLAAPRGRLELYEGADHFFSHDDRFAARFVQDCLDFARTVCPPADPAPAAR
jgi:pimeloyl-ACP methyl ester carboxylesterase